MIPFLSFTPDYDNGGTGHAMLPNGYTLCGRYLSKTTMDEDGTWRYGRPDEYTLPCAECESTIRGLM